MDWDEPSLKKAPTLKDLGPLSLGELNDYIAELRAEIVRAEAEITRKQGQKNAAENFFKS